MKNSNATTAELTSLITARTFASLDAALECVELELAAGAIPDEDAIRLRSLVLFEADIMPPAPPSPPPSGWDVASA
jgi:hypothetical protein